MKNHANSLILQNALHKLKETFASMPALEEPRYECLWCHDTGMVHCYREKGINFPIKWHETAQVEREKNQSPDYVYFVVCPCGFCEAGTRRGRLSERGKQAAERWVQENVTKTVSLKGIYEKAKEAGFSESVIDQAFRQVGILKEKVAGRWMCKPAA